MVWSESCKIPHAKSTNKTTACFKKRPADWCEFEPTSGSKSPPSTFAKCHMADSRIAYFTKIHIFPTLFNGFLAEQLLHCYHAKHTWRDMQKILKMPFWLILLPTAATSVFGTPKRLISCSSNGPIWVDGRVPGTHFQRRIHPCARLHPFRV